MEQLDAIGFAWKSTLKCGSSFMGTYQTLKERLRSCCRPVETSNGNDTWELVDRGAMEEILREDKIRTWLRM